MMIEIERPHEGANVGARDERVYDKDVCLNLPVNCTQGERRLPARLGLIGKLLECL